MALTPSRGGGKCPTPVPYRNFVRYCEYPGNRLFASVKFDVNGNPLDQYDMMVPTMLEKFCTPPNKRIGHDRLVGQEVPLTGYSGLCCASVSDSDGANTPAGITKFGAGQSNQSVALFDAADLHEGVTKPLGQVQSQFDLSRKLLQFVNGPQTPKPIQPPLEIWNKLRFWFNDDVRLSIPSVSIPFGQRFITIELAQQSSLAFEYPSIYLETTSITGTSAPLQVNIIEIDGAINAVTVEGSGNLTTNLTRSYSPIFQKLGMQNIAIEKMELYINNIFVNPEVHDIYIKRIGFSLIRVYRQHTQRCNRDGSDEVLLSQLKWPIEYMFVGLRPTWNIKETTATAGFMTGGNFNMWRDWHRLTRLADAECDENSVAEVNSFGVVIGAVNATSAIGQVTPDTYFLPVPTVDSLTLTSHGITIFDGLADTFFNQYLPFHYGGQALNTPDDPGALFVNMALFPRSYQPSGHLNISRARETYLKWTTSYVSAKTPADLIAVAVAINFLLITDGSAVLRYST